VNGGPVGEWEGEPVSRWRLRWAVPRLEVFASLPSTNDRLRALAEDGAAPFTTVIAEEQTAGRGRHGRSWSSPTGMGLWISMLLRGPSLEALRLSPILLGIASARAVEEVAPSLSIGIKWPNDLIGGREGVRVAVGTEEGGKVAGILCESSAGGGVVAGIGINVRQRPEDFPAALGEAPVSLEMLVGGAVDRARLAGALIRQAKALLDPAPETLPGAVAEELARRDILAGRRVRLSIPLEGSSGAAPREGIADGIDPEGALRVVDDEGVRRAVISGSVRLVNGPEHRS
jgi:BirA family transcriptional regulator, biotin operon repressor / biotin---[acetyl-CoA-carboxylase] ligase